MKYINFLFLFVFVCVPLVFGRGDLIEFEKSYEVGSDVFFLQIDIDGGKVEFMKNDQTNECHVMMKYPAERCEHEIEFEKSRNRLVIVVDHEWMSGKDKHEDDFTKVMVALPTGPEIELKSDIKAGEIDFELGDLRIKNFDLHNWAGEVNIDFDSPNRTVLESFDVNVKIGELNIRRLGNANFEEADINSGIGELNVDFSGQKIKRARAFIDLDIGETTVTVPEEIGVKMKVSRFLFLSEVDYPNWFDKRGKYHYSSNCDEGNEDLYLSVSSGIGEFKVRVR